MAKITVSKESVINNAIGTHTCHRTTPIFDYTTGTPYTSMKDAAIALNCSPMLVSQACSGAVKTCKGHVLGKVKATSENSDMLASRIRVLNAENAALRTQAEADAEDARKWREYQAQIEAARIAEEKRIEQERRAEEVRQKQLAILRAKLERGEAREARLVEELDELTAKYNDRIERNEAIRKAIAELEGVEE